jgi:hypothetical protein
MNYPILKRLFTLFCCLFSVLAYAQQPYFISINDATGLPSNNVYNVVQDAKGFIWIASNEGLCRYDGKNFKSYKNPAQTSLPGSNIQEDSKGRIWYQNFDGFCYYVENDAMHALQQNTPIGFFPIGITPDNIFLVQDDGIDVFDINTLKLIKTIPFPYTKKELNHTATWGNKFYLLSSEGLFIIDKTLQFKKLSVDIKEGNYNQIHICNGNIVLSSRFNEKGLFAILDDKQTVERIYLPEFAFIHAIYFIDNSYWALTPKGAYIFKEGKFLNHVYPNSSLSAVCKDRSGNIWLSTTQNGLKLIPSLQTIFTPIVRFEPNLIENSEKGFLLFTQSGEIVALDAKFKEQEILYKSASMAAFYYTYQDTSSKLVLASSSGVNLFSTQPFKSTLFNQIAVKEVVKLDQKYYAFASSGNACLYKSPRATGNFKSYWDPLFYGEQGPIKDTLVSFMTGVRAKTIACDTVAKAIYVGANVGLFKQTLKDRIEIKHHGEQLFISKLVAYGQSFYALNTKGELLLLQNDSVLRVLNQQKNIQISEIKAIKAFGKHLCIMGEDRLLVLDMEDISKLVYSLEIPIKTSEISDLILQDEQLHLLVKNGVISSPISKQNKQKKQAFFAVTGFELSGQSLNTLPVTLTHNQNQITIQYAILNFASVNPSHLWYKINEENWVLSDPNLRSLQFAYLAPGKYRLQFKLNDTLLPNDAVEFTIEKPIWQQLWFQLLCGLVLLGLGISYYKWQISILVKKNRLTTEKMELENALNMSRLRSIKSQMNPHFFYNALNTIQSYIFTNDKKRASNYLGKFSNLTRMILEMSEMDLVGLTQELTALKLYLELEQMRFEEDLKCTLEVDEELDEEMIKLPPMLIQPFIENALKHGLMHKMGKKELLVKFEHYQEGFIKVIIDDNGIGREGSALLNQNRLVSHQSFASTANETRLSILNKGSGNHFGLDIQDKKNEDGTSNGTRVSLIIPIN